MPIFRKITPSSERYVYYLAWLSSNGGIRSYLFSHTGGSETKEVKNFNVETFSDFRSIPEESRDMVRVEAGTLGSDMYDYVCSILESNRIYQVLEDSTKIPVAIKGKKIKKENQNKSFSLSFDILFKEKDILNV